MRKEFLKKIDLDILQCLDRRVPVQFEADLTSGYILRACSGQKGLLITHTTTDERIEIPGFLDWTYTKKYITALLAVSEKPTHDPSHTTVYSYIPNFYV